MLYFKSRWNLIKITSQEIISVDYQIRGKVKGKAKISFQSVIQSWRTSRSSGRSRKGRRALCCKCDVTLSGTVAWFECAIQELRRSSSLLHQKERERERGREQDYWHMDYIFVKRTHVKRSSAHSEIETFVFQTTMWIHMQMRVRLKATNVHLAKRMAITKRAIDRTIKYLASEKFASSLATEFTILVRI